MAVMKHVKTVTHEMTQVSDGYTLHTHKLALKGLLMVKTWQQRCLDLLYYLTAALALDFDQECIIPLWYIKAEHSR